MKQNGCVSVMSLDADGTGTGLPVVASCSICRPECFNATTRWRDDSQPQQHLLHTLCISLFCCVRRCWYAVTTWGTWTWTKSTTSCPCCRRGRRTSRWRPCSATAPRTSCGSNTATCTVSAPWLSARALVFSRSWRMTVQTSVWVGAPLIYSVDWPRSSAVP